MHRILDISESPAKLHVDHGCLMLEMDAATPLRIPIPEVAALILSHPCIRCTQSVLAELAVAGAVVIVCDKQRRPAGLQLPLQAHYLQAERFLAQTRAKLPLRKQLWREIVRAKIRLQAGVLRRCRGTDAGLSELAALVKSGDPANVEARAARRYWTCLFPGADFHRDREALDQNQLLNYGYAVLRALVARAASAVGLHPSLGVHHRNRYNAFCLADDLMEPFRPAVDLVVANLVEQHGADAPLDRAARGEVLAAMYQRWRVGKESRTLFEAAESLASSVAENFLGTRHPLRLPISLEPADALPGG